MNDDFDYLLWAYKATFKQTDVGGGSIAVQITANERIVILFGRIGPNDYAAGRNVKVRISDEDDDVIATIMSVASVDNNTYHFPVADHSVVASSDGPQLEKRVVLGKGDYLDFAATSLAQNEELTVIIRALMRDWPPTVTTTGSGGTVTTTVAYDKVI